MWLGYFMRVEDQSLGMEMGDWSWRVGDVDVVEF